MREIDEELNESKYSTITFNKDGVTFMDMYHYYTCPELGTAKTALRQVPCYCENCNKQIQLPWIHGNSPEEQPRFDTINNCYFSSIVGEENNWWFVEMTERNDSVKEDGDQLQFEVLQSVTAAVALGIEDGNYGALSTSDETKEDYWIVKFTTDAYTDQDTSNLMCKGKYWYEVGVSTDHWFYQGDEEVEEEIEVSRIVMA